MMGRLSSLFASLRAIHFSQRHRDCGTDEDQTIRMLARARLCVSAGREPLGDYRQSLRFSDLTMQT
jgi:hypothetical protein